MTSKDVQLATERRMGARQQKLIEELRAENERLRWIIIAMQHGNEDALEQAKQMDMQGFVDFLNDADAAE